MPPSPYLEGYMKTVLLVAAKKMTMAFVWQPVRVDLNFSHRADRFLATVQSPVP